jgi:two-component system, cell cycle response regulator DivK
MPGRLLIIDDDERNVFALQAVLKAKKFYCVLAGSGMQALAILKTIK